MAPQLRQLGVGAKTSCLSKFLHPSEQIRNKYPNPVAGHRLEGCVVVRQEMKSMSWKDQLCIVVQHDDFKAGDDHIELHAVKCYFRVTTEGDLDLFFDVAPTTDNGEANEAQTPLPTAVDEAINGCSEEANTNKALQGVVEIDDDNELAEENAPTTTATTNRILSTEWGHNGFCFRKSQKFGNT